MAQRQRALQPPATFGAVFADVQERLPAASLRDWRRASFARFSEQGIPTTRAEAWKYTNVAPVANLAMALAPKVDVGLHTISPHLLGGPKARRLIFANGHVVPELSHVQSLPAGMRVMSLGRALETDPGRVAAVLAEAEDDRSFTALNAAFAGGGSWIELDDGVDAGEALQLLFLTVGQAAPFMSHPRNIVRLGAGARLRLIESHVGIGEGQSLTNFVGAGPARRRCRSRARSGGAGRWRHVPHRQAIRASGRWRPPVADRCDPGRDAGAQRDRSADRGCCRRLPA